MDPNCCSPASDCKNLEYVSCGLAVLGNEVTCAGHANARTRRILSEHTNIMVKGWKLFLSSNLVLSRVLKHRSAHDFTVYFFI